MYIQVDGVSMRSPLGPLFANFYMAELENNTIPFLKPKESPLVYSPSLKTLRFTVHT